jgi:hypothetical protein
MVLSNKSLGLTAPILYLRWLCLLFVFAHYKDTTSTGPGNQKGGQGYGCTSLFNVWADWADLLTNPNHSVQSSPASLVSQGSGLSHGMAPHLLHTENPIEDTCIPFFPSTQIFSLCVFVSFFKLPARNARCRFPCCIGMDIRYVASPSLCRFKKNVKDTAS